MQRKHEASTHRDGRTRSRRLPARFYAIEILVLFIFVGWLSGSFGQANAKAADPAWETLRQRVPGHFQDWIVAGSGPQFTLLYTEPPPAYGLKDYGHVLRAAFRGYKDHAVETRSLGYNGHVRDLVIHLDYSSDTQTPFSALERDVVKLSTVIYGTAIGARVLRLEELAGRPPTVKTPLPISVSAAELETWLFKDPQPIALHSPELGVSGRLAALSDAGPAGRYLASDNSVVVLLVERARGINAELLPHVRAFAVDSDFILGGVVDDKRKFAALIGRSRQLPLAEFPALRVEDIVNAMTAKDANWAQSYDRHSPGAGRADLPDGSSEDWAPSYLSADLVDTEFGSLLNHADAVLKSQSLSDKIRYRGYSIAGFPNTPYPEGVFDHLRKKIGQSSLVFNFNTVGVGHWLTGDEDRRIYALNSTGSFSVTYSPNTTGKDSTLKQADPIDEAQRAYTTWFRQQRNYELVRTVQYMAIYQVFSGLNLGGARLYGDTAAKYRLIGQQLKESVKAGAMAGLVRLTGEDRQKLNDIDRARRLVLLQKGRLFVALPEMPKTLNELATAIGSAAIEVRYDGNLFGDRQKVLLERIETVTRQLEKTFKRYEERYEKYQRRSREIEEEYKPFEKGRREVRRKGKLVMEMQYELPPDKSGAFERDKAAFGEIANVVEPVIEYCNRLAEERNALSDELDRLHKAYLNRELLLDAVAWVTRAKNRHGYSTDVLNAFAARTGAARFATSEYAIATPTIVVSVDKSDVYGTMTGGHNVEVQKFTIRRDESIPAGGFQLDGGVLLLNPSDAPKMGQLSAQMARVADADPATQQRVFAATLKSIKSVPTPRLTALAVNLTTEALGLKTSSAVEATYSAVVEGGVSSETAVRTLVLGRDASSKRFYFERPGTGGDTQRVAVLGVNRVPEIIAGMGTRNAAADMMEVVLDTSLGVNDFDAIIANYKNAGEIRPATADGGGGKRDLPPRSRWASGSEPESRGPRIVLFTESRSGRQRAIVETKRGRVEIIVPKSADPTKTLAALKTGIERQARLTVRTDATVQNAAGTEFLLVGFEILQPKPIAGQAAAHAPAGRGLLAKGVDWFHGILKSAFDDVRASAKLEATAADYIVEVNRRTEDTGHGWRVVWKMVVEGAAIRFVAEPVPDALKGKHEQGLLMSKAE